MTTGLNKGILSLGSNLDAENNMQKAVDRLKSVFSSIYFSDIVSTEPVGMPPGTPFFLNQAALLYTTKELSEVLFLLKETEQLLGRKPEDKQTGHIPVDIDLLQWNDCVFKEEDMKREYMITLLTPLVARK